MMTLNQTPDGRWEIHEDGVLIRRYGSEIVARRFIKDHKKE